MSTHLSLGTSTASSVLTPQETHHQEIVEDLEYKQRCLAITFREWVHGAEVGGVDVVKQRHKMENVARSRPAEMNNLHQREVWLLYETTMLNIITSQIIRKMAETSIIQNAKAARAMPQLNHQIGLINECERFLLRKLPGELPQIVAVETATKQYNIIMDELKKMGEKILSKAKKG